ncbi:BTAD domain-containing putative transcriptional regulator [Streptomyces kronopolitis]
MATRTRLGVLRPDEAPHTSREGIGNAVRCPRLDPWRGAEAVDRRAAIHTGQDSPRPGAREECFGVGPSMGHHHRQAPRVLCQAVAEGPLRERLSGRMVPTLHRCGRRTDALSVFGRLGGERAARADRSRRGSCVVRNAPSSNTLSARGCRWPGPRGSVEGRPSGPGCRPV